MRWDDIHWDAKRFTVHSPKTAYIEGKGSRIVPLFPELEPFLLDAFEHVEEGQEYVFEQLRRSASKNLRTQALRYIKMAGVKPWKKTFQNLRSSRQTELVETWPEHVVAAWLGNSVEIARKHYLQVTDEHFDRATNGTPNMPESAAQNPTHLMQNVAQNPTQQAHARARSEWKNEDATDVLANFHAGQCDVDTKRCDSLRAAPHTPTGSRTPVSRMRT